MTFFKKQDLIIYALVLILFVCSFFLWGRTTGSTGDIVVISVNGSEKMTLPLNEDTEVLVNGFLGLTCNVVVQNGTVRISEATCPDKLCARHEPISKDGESIICLPARITVTVRSSKPSDIDAIAR
ncbi:MAG: NusG domain II-containing protein [Lachnospiraceae bacterium]|nr:NusG domain II-containing protein [Lachnospiraceae bacterium]